jgi:hypothetical protein
MPDERKHLTLSIQARCETLARGFHRWTLGTITVEDYVAELKATMLRAVAFAFQEFPELEGRAPLDDPKDLGEQMRRKCLVLAVMCVGTLPGERRGSGEVARADGLDLIEQEDHVCRFLERAMLAHGNIVAQTKASAREAMPETRKPEPPAPADEAPIFVPCLPAFVATRGEDPGVLVTRAWEAGYRAGVGISRFFRRLDADRVASLEHQQALLSERITVLERTGK